MSSNDGIDMSVIIPNPCARTADEVPGAPDEIITAGTVISSAVCTGEPTEVLQKHVVPIDRYSSFCKLVRVTMHVRNFVAKLKNKLLIRKSNNNDPASLFNYTDTYPDIIRIEQNSHFPEIFEYFQSPTRSTRKMPNLVSQLNLCLDENSILRVKCKFSCVRER